MVMNSDHPCHVLSGLRCLSRSITINVNEIYVPYTATFPESDGMRQRLYFLETENLMYQMLIPTWAHLKHVLKMQKQKQHKLSSLQHFQSFKGLFFPLFSLYPYPVNLSKQSRIQLRHEHI